MKSKIFTMITNFKWITLSFYILLQTNLVFCQNPNYLWHRIFNDCSSGFISSQVVTEDNDLYILAIHQGLIDVDPSVYDSLPQSGMTLIKYDDQRRYVWHKTIANMSGSMSLKIDVEENIFIYGSSTGYTIDSDSITTIINEGANILKFGSDGQLFWAKQLHSNPNFSFNSMDIDYNGNLYLTGQASDFDVDPSPAINMLGNISSGVGAYLVKWDNDGNYKDAFPLSNSQPLTHGYNVNIFNNLVFISGRAYGEIDLNSSTLGIHLVGQTSTMSGFVACYDTSFNFVNGIAINNSGNSFVSSISSSGLTIAGAYFQSFDADPSIGIANLINNTYQNLPYFIRYNLNLEYQWGAYLQKNENEPGSGADVIDIAQKSNGEFFIMGNMTAMLDVNPGIGIYYLPHINNNTDTYYAHYSNSGTLIDARTFSNLYSKIIGEISCSNKTRFFVGGGYRGSIDLNPNSNNEENELLGTLNKPFLAEFATISPEYITLNDTICAGEIYHFGDEQYTESGRYLHRFEKNNGSDSIVNLQLYVKKMDMEIYSSGGYIHSRELVASSYSILNCTNGQVYATSENNSIQPPSNDFYSLILTKEECTDTTECIQISIANNAGTPSLEWGANISKFNLNQNMGMTTDKYNNVYVAGNFSEICKVNLFGENLFMKESPISPDMIVCKYNTNGQLQWSYSMGVQGTAFITENANCIKVDQEGNVYVGGTYENSVDMNSDEMYYDIMQDLSPTSCCSFRAFLLKLNEHGQLIWYKTFGSSTSSTTNIFDIDFDKNGNVGIIGSSETPIDLDPNIGVFLSPTKGIFFGKYTSTGEFLYGHSILTNAGNHSFNSAIRFDHENNMVVTGRSNLIADYDPSTVEYTLNAGTVTNHNFTFLAKYDSIFNLKWARIFGKQGNNLQPYADMEIDIDNNILLMTGLSGPNSFPDETGYPAHTVNFYGS